ncbi:MAG: enoyl-CoA hydratase-related protein [Deltaproteobacteria bacterium]|nr:enoyl-CoA hydratase-related protein [Deltaproteobacteria bacterium]
MSDDLLYEKKDQVAWLTINREPRRNAISQEMITAFLDHLQSADTDEDIRTVCITAAGEKVFCSGADLAVTLVGNAEDRLVGPRHYARLLKEMAAFGKPLVARVNGACLAGGIGLMLSCDIVIARNDTYFCTPEVNVGIFPMMVGALLFKNVTYKKVMDMVLTGRKIDAAKAEQMGLISRAVEPANLNEAVQRTLSLLTGKSPIGTRIGKEAFHRAHPMPFDDAVDHLCEALGRVISTEDAAEGIIAFMEKRKPEFKGK